MYQDGTSEARSSGARPPGRALGGYELGTLLPRTSVRGAMHDDGHGHVGERASHATRDATFPSAMRVAARRDSAMIECCGFTPRFVGNTLESTT